jgi:hypothetical protein
MVAKDGLPLRVGDWWETVPVEEGNGVFVHKLRIRSLTDTRERKKPRLVHSNLIVDSVSGGLDRVRADGWRMAFGYFICDIPPDSRLNLTRVDEKLYPMLNLILNDLFAEAGLRMRVRGRRNFHTYRDRDII